MKTKTFSSKGYGAFENTNFGWLKYDARRKNTYYGGMTRTEFTAAQEKKILRMICRPLTEAEIIERGQVAHYIDNVRYLKRVMTLSSGRTHDGFEDYATSVEIKETPRRIGVVAICRGEPGNSTIYWLDGKERWERYVAYHFLKILKYDFSKLDPAYIEKIKNIEKYKDLVRSLDAIGVHCWNIDDAGCHINCAEHQLILLKNGTYYKFATVEGSRFFYVQTFKKGDEHSLSLFIQKIASGNTEEINNMYRALYTKISK